MKVKLKPENLESKGLFRKVKITLETEGELMLFFEFISQLNDEMVAPFGIHTEEDNDVIYKKFVKLKKAIKINCIDTNGKYENIFQIKNVR